MPNSARRAVGGAGALTALLAALYAVIHVDLVQHADASILSGFGDFGRHPRVGSIASDIAGLCNPNPYVYLCLIPVAMALLRRRLWVALVIVAVLLGACFTTELLKPLLDVHRSYSLPGAPGNGSWPSGHATAAMSLALCCVLAAPAWLRPAAAAAGAVFAVAVCYSFLSLEWHYPTDVLGGFLVASIWSLLGVAAIWTAYGHRARQPVPAEGTNRPTIWASLGPPSAVLLAAVVLVVLVVIARPHDVVSYARAHKAFLIGAGGIGALALALATGAMLMLRR
ncbi:MAG: phosphatase PAP2 family protein [Solirubrobacteraceae bacterium]